MAYEFVSSGQSDDQYTRQLEADALARGNGVYPRTIFVALGGTGAKALLHLRRMVLERFGRVDALPGVAYLSIDTDTGSASPAPTDDEQKKDPFAPLVAFHPERERINLSANISTLLGPNLAMNPHIREWWDESLHLTQQGFNIEKGAGQIRPLARLLFFQNQGAIAERLIEAHGRVSHINVSNTRVSRADPVRVVVVSGWAGGTGSGTFLDMGALIKETIPEAPISLEGIFALPSVIRSKEKTYAKAAANGCAALREVNHFLGHPFEAKWSANGRRVEVRGLYDRYLLVSGTNYVGTELGSDDAVYRAIAEALFLDFSAGQMAGWIQGVRINRAQYLKSYVTYQYRLTKPDNTTVNAHADKWLTEFATFGIAKLSFPAWRLLNYAKYDLAAEMAGLMDRAQVGSMDDLIGIHRDRFMHAAGFFQGEMTTEEGGRQTHWQVRDALARVSGVAGDVGSIFDHIAKLVAELKSMAESSYADKSTIADCEARWREAKRLLGDAGSPGAEGDWIVQLRKNRLSFVQSVRDILPKVIEEFREKPAVGPSGVRYVLESVLETLGRPADQTRYGDFFRNEVPRLEGRAAEAKSVWDRQIRNADEASRGLFKAADTHKEAMAKAGEAFDTYWSCRFKTHLADEAVKALDEVKTIIREQLGLLERICEAIAGLRAHFLNCRQYYATSQVSPIARELPFDNAQISKLLEPYLGTAPEERRNRLSRLLQRGLREMGLTTLEALSSKLANDQDAFRENLAAQAFYALRGHNGYTSAFTADETQQIEGFIERNAILRKLPAGNTAEMERLVRELYQAALPLLALYRDSDASRLVSAKMDAFLGLVQVGGGADEAAHQSSAARMSLENTLRNVQRADFAPQLVAARDPTEIILYTEMNAFPAYALRDIYRQGGMRDHYETTLFNEAKTEPLHIHRDYLSFQDIVPLELDEVSKLRRAWKSFLQGQFLGVIRSMPARMDDTTRFVYQMYTRRSAHEAIWTDLGPEPLVLRRIMNDRSFDSTLQRHLDQELQRFRDSDGRWSHLCALADYTYHLIFPAISLGGQAGPGQSGAAGSMAGMALASIRDDWREEAARAGEGRSPEDVELLIEPHIRALAHWTQPIARDLGKHVPLTVEPQRDALANEWALSALAHEAVDAFVGRNHLPGARNEAGQKLFPRIAINWEAFRRADVPDAPLRFNYRGPTGAKAHLDLPTVGQLVNQNPNARHDVIQAGWADWKEARDVPAIAAALGLPPPAASTAPPALQPPSSPPAPTRTAAAPETFLYARDGETLGELSASAIAAEVQKRPTALHAVFHSRLVATWRAPGEVPAIAARLGAVSAPPPPAPAPPRPSLPPRPAPTPGLAGELFHYKRDNVDQGQMSAPEVAAEVERAPAERHRVWNRRLDKWHDALAVPEIARLVAMPPPDDDGPPPDDE